jgi:hypothetical protein
VGRRLQEVEVYEFTIVVLLGLAVFKLVDWLNEWLDVSRVQFLVTIVLGALVAWVLGFSLFGLWSIPVRSEALAYIGTGLVLAAAGYAVPKVFEHVSDIIGHRRPSSMGKAA